MCPPIHERVANAVQRIPAQASLHSESITSFALNSAEGVGLTTVAVSFQG